jgi:hypothetical protein
LHYKKNKSSLGFTVTLPIANINLIGKGRIRKSISIDISSVDPSNNFITSTEQTRLTTTYKSAWIFDFAVSRKLGENSRIHGKIAYFSSIKKYNMLETDKSQRNVFDYNIPENSSFYTIQKSNKSVVNFALGIEQKITNSVKILVGYCSDKNNFDESSINPSEAFIINTSVFDKQHFSGGVEFSSKKYRLVAGLTYDIGDKTNTPSRSKFKYSFN